jgi:4-hydroxybenzoate polyprenyltransferase
MSQVAPASKTTSDLSDVLIESFGYTVVVVVSLLSGFLSNYLNGAIPFFDLSKVFEIFYKCIQFIMYLSVFCFLQFFLRAILLDPKINILDNIGSSVVWRICTICSLAALISAFAYSPWNAFYTSLILSKFIIILVIWSLVSNAGKDEEVPSAHFAWKTFYPAFSVLMTYFCVGWDLYSVSTPSVVIEFLYFCSFFAVYIIRRFGPFQTAPSVPKFVLLHLALVLVFSAVSFFAAVDDYTPALMMGFFWVMILGIFEVVKMPSIIIRNKYGKDSDYTNFYVRGSNWSTLVFLHSSIFLVYLYYTPAVIIYCVVCLMLSLAWTFTSEKEHIQKWIRFLGFFMPLFFLVVISFGHVYYPIWSDISGYQQYAGTTATIISLMVAVFFVIYSNVYIAFPVLHKEGTLFSEKEHCIMLIPIVIIVCMVTIFSVYSIYQISSGGVSVTMSRKLDTILTIFMIEMIVMFASILFFGNNKRDDGRKNLKQQSNVAGKNKVDGVQRKMEAIVCMTRPITASLAGVFSFSAYTSSAVEWNFSTALSVFAIGSVLCMFGFCVNDLMDLHKDSESGRTDKVLVNRQINRGDAIVILLLFIAVLFLMSASVSASVLNLVCFGIFGLFLYSPFARLMPILKGLYTGLLTCLPMAIGFQSANADVPAFFICTVVSLIIGREILIDLDDYDFDRKVRMRTVPVMIGKQAALVIGWSIVVASCFIAAEGLSNDVSKLIMAVTAFFMIIIAILTQYERLSRGISLSRIPMLMALIALMINK